MSRVKSKNLYDLIRSLNKNEKRYFKLFVSSSGDIEEKKMILLFDEINQQEAFDENKILNKLKSIDPKQLSNLKAYLYDKILLAIRQYYISKVPDIQIRQQIDYAQILFQRRLFNQGITCLSTAKKLAKSHNNLELQLEIIKLEKSILMSTIDYDLVEKVDRIIHEVRTLNTQINHINIFSNLAIKLNSYYTKTGYIRDEGDFNRVKSLFYEDLPEYKEDTLTIWEKTYLYRLFVGYYFFVQDFENGYLYSKKLLETFESSPQLVQSDIDSYLKAFNSLLVAQYKLLKYPEFVATNEKLHAFIGLHDQELSENLKINSLKYYYIHEINRYFMNGDFDKGIEVLIKRNERQLLDLISKIDKHSELIINYKIACVYFGASKFNLALKWINKIINESHADIREDLHCFARIINLVCHFELGNNDVIEHYIIQTYRFLLKKDDLHLFQKYILGFLRSLNRFPSDHQLITAFKKLKAQLLPLEHSRYEKRAFIYFDIISWLESKIEKRSVQEIIQAKAMKRLSIEV